MRVSYEALPGLEHVYLEDSYVLDLCVCRDAVEFELDVVLTPEHPSYKKPSPQEQYCMRRAVLRFPNATVIKLNRSGARPAVDATGAMDYGNVDTFYLESATYYLDGEWGDIQIVSDPPILTIK